MSSEQIKQDIDRLNNSAQKLQGQIDALSQRIAELKADRSGIERFGNQVNSDKAHFETTLARKRAGAAKAGQIAHSHIATGISAMFGKRFDTSFERNVQGCFDGVGRSIRKAVAEIEDEIRNLQRQIAGAEKQLLQTRRSIEQQKRSYEEALMDERAHQD